MKAHVLISGSSGSIGTATAEALMDQEYVITGIDRFPNQWSPRVQERTIIADLCDLSQFSRFPQGADFFIHFAANPFVFPSVENPKLARENVELTLNALEFCRRTNIRKFIFASSREVYGNSSKKVRSESGVQLEDIESPYAASKIAGEAFVHAYQKCFGIDFLILRFSNVYGRFDASDRLIPRVIGKNRRGEDVTVFGEKKSLSFTYMDDVVQGIVLALTHFDRAKNQVLNIAHPDSTPIIEVVGLLQKKMNSAGKIVMGETRTGEVETFTPDISKAKKILGFDPQTDIKTGIEKTVLWYEKNL